MLGRSKLVAIASAVAIAAVTGFGTAGVARAATPVALVVPQSTAFAVLGHSCGGIQEQAFGTGFDPSSGFPQGDVHLQTTCNGSGRGSHPTTYTGWVSATWDDTGALLSYAVPASAPVVNPTFSAFDSYGNELYNASNNAYLLLAPTFVPTPRVTSLSVTVGPANGGTSVTIGGTGFTGATAVAFGGQPAASFAVNGDNSIAAVTPVAPGGRVTVTVTTSGGTSGATANAQFTFVGPPVVSGVSPKTGLVTGGNSVTITGASLTYVSAVSFGETATSFVVNSDTSITAIAPYYDAPDTVNIKLTSLGGSNAPTSASRYSYKTYERVMPASGPSTINVTVSGGGFSPGEPVTASYKTALAAPSPAWVTVCTGHAAPDGTFSCGGPIPGAPTAGASGSHTIRAKGGHSRFTASTIFTLS